MQSQSLSRTILRIGSGLLCIVCLLLAVDTLHSSAQTATPLPTATEPGPLPTDTLEATVTITVPIVTVVPTHTGTVPPPETPTTEPPTTTPGTPTITPTGSITPPTGTPSPEPTASATPEPTAITATPPATTIPTTTITPVPTAVPTQTSLPEPTTTTTPTGTVAPITTPPLPESADEANFGARTITVIGKGYGRGELNIAQAQIGLQSLQPTIQDASRTVEEQLIAVTEILRGQGIEEDAMQMVEHTITREGSATTGGYRVRKVLIITLNRADQVATILDQVAAAGPTSLVEVTFTRDEAGEWKTTAWASALEHARQQANHIAGALNVRLGPILHVRELDSSRLPGHSGGTNIGSAPMLPAGDTPVPALRVEVVFSIWE